MLHPNRLASARLIAPDIVEQKYPHAEGDFWLGRSPFANGQMSGNGLPLGVDDDRHFLLVGGTRGGKGNSFVVPNHCLWPGSLLSVDPKGENAMLTADARAEGRNGRPQPVYVLDPFHVARIVNQELRASFNPLWELMEPDPDGEDWGEPGDEDYEPAMRPSDDAVDEAAIVATALIVDGEKGSTNPFWNTSAKRLISALILHVLTNERFRGRRNLVTVRQLIMTGDEDLLAAAQAEHPEITSAAALMWNDVALNPAFDGVIHEDGAFIYDMMRNDPETYTGVQATAASHTEFLRSPKIRAIIRQSSFRLEQLKLSTTGISIYLCLPQRFADTDHYRWLRMVIGLATQQMEKTQGRCRSGHKVLMILDEFTALRRMPAIEEALTGYAGHGLKMLFAVQTLDKLATVYEKGWESFVSQCGVKAFFNADDNFTRKYVSELVGETDICIRNAGESETATHTGGWSEMDTDSRNTGGSTSDGTGSAHQEGDSTSWSTGTGGGRNENRTWGHNTNQTDSHGHGYGTADSQGGGSGVSQVAYTSLLRKLFGMGVGWKPEWTVSSNTNWNHTNSTNENFSHADSEGFSEGGGSGSQVSWNDTTGGGRNRSDSTNRNHTVSTNYQDGHSHATGRSGSDALGKGTSVTEQWQRRPVFLPEEIGRFFAAPDEESDARYPGLALVLVGGKASMVVRRINYYQDARFAGLYNPHLDYDAPVRPQPVLAAAPALALPVPPNRQEINWSRLVQKIQWTAIGLLPIVGAGLVVAYAGWGALILLLGLGVGGTVVWLLLDVLTAKPVTPEAQAARARQQQKDRAFQLALKGDHRAYQRIWNEDSARVAKYLEQGDGQEERKV